MSTAYIKNYKEVLAKMSMAKLPDPCYFFMSLVVLLAGIGIIALHYLGYFDNEGPQPENFARNFGIGATIFGIIGVWSTSGSLKKK